MKKSSIGRLAALAVTLASAGVSNANAGDSPSYRFQKPPVNSMGVKSMAELRGKPVLIDFWGTR
jgi:hypothetical protein